MFTVYMGCRKCMYTLYNIIIQENVISGMDKPIYIYI